MGQKPLVLKASQLLLALDYFEFVDLARSRHRGWDETFYPVPETRNPRRFNHETAKDMLKRFGFEWTNRSDVLPISRLMQEMLRSALNQKVNFLVEADRVIDEMVACSWIDEFVVPSKGAIDHAGDRSSPTSYISALTRFITAIATGELTENDLL